MHPGLPLLLEICVATRIVSHAPGPVGAVPEGSNWEWPESAPSLFCPASDLLVGKWAKERVGRNSRSNWRSGNTHWALKPGGASGDTVKTVFQVACCSLSLIWHEMWEPESWLEHRECREGCCATTAWGWCSRLYSKGVAPNGKF